MFGFSLPRRSTRPSLSFGPPGSGHEQQRGRHLPKVASAIAVAAMLMVGGHLHGSAQTGSTIRQPNPTIDGTIPSGGAAPGETVTLTGNWFNGNGWTVSSVIVGGQPATFRVISPTRLDLLVPALTKGQTAITVTTASSSSSASTTYGGRFVVTGPGMVPPAPGSTAGPGTSNTAAPRPVQSPGDTGIGGQSSPSTAAPAATPLPGSNPAATSAGGPPEAGAGASGPLTGAIAGSVEGPNPLPLADTSPLAAQLRRTLEDPSLIPGLGFGQHPFVAWTVLLLIAASLGAELQANLSYGWPRPGRWWVRLVPGRRVPPRPDAGLEPAPAR